MVLYILFGILIMVLIWSNIVFVRKYNNERKEFNDLSTSYLSNVAYVNRFVKEHIDNKKLYEDTGVYLESGSPEDISNFVGEFDNFEIEHQESVIRELKEKKRDAAELSIKRFIYLREALEPIMIDGAEFKIEHLNSNFYRVCVTKGHYNNGFNFTLSNIESDPRYNLYEISYFSDYIFTTDLKYDNYTLKELESSEWIIKEFKSKWDENKDAVVGDEEYVLKAKRELERVSI